ncbi:MAG: hypothetical protein RLZZ621_1826 [Gemmatimonadota bacterium]
MVAGALGVMVLAACGDAGRNEAAARDSALASDLAIAQRDSAVQPQLQDVPVPDTTARPAPVAAPAPAPARTPSAAPRPRPTPAPRTPAPVSRPADRATVAAPAELITGTVPAGTPMSFATTSRICSNTTAVGEQFTGTLSQAVRATNGVTVPEGTTGTFEVTERKTAQNSKDDTFLRIRLVSIRFGGLSYPVDATVHTVPTERVRSASKADDAKKVAGGAVIGAIAGQVLGKNTRGTVIGAAAGAAAGSAAAAMSGNYDSCIADGAPVSLTLNAPITVRPAPTP